MFWARRLFRPLYGSLFLLFIASMMGGITLATQVLKANFLQLGKELEEASLTSGAGFWGTYFRIVLPLMGQTMALIGVLKFLFAARTASSVILLATSETRTLALLALDQIAGGYREAASITVLFIVLLTTGVALVARSLGLKVGIQGRKRWSWAGDHIGADRRQPVPRDHRLRPGGAELAHSGDPDRRWRAADPARLGHAWHGIGAGGGGVLMQLRGWRAARA